MINGTMGLNRISYNSYSLVLFIPIHSPMKSYRKIGCVDRRLANRVCFEATVWFPCSAEVLSAAWSAINVIFMGFYGIFMGFNGLSWDLIGCYCDFNGILMGFHRN